MLTVDLLDEEPFLVDPFYTYVFPPVNMKPFYFSACLGACVRPCGGKDWRKPQKNDLSVLTSRLKGVKPWNIDRFSGILLATTEKVVSL